MYMFEFSKTLFSNFTKKGESFFNHSKVQYNIDDKRIYIYVLLKMLKMMELQLFKFHFYFLGHAMFKSF